MLLNDSQKAIIMSTLKDQLKMMPAFLNHNTLSNLEAGKISHMLNVSEGILDYLSETDRREFDFSEEQLAVIVFGLTSFAETCQQLLGEEEKIAEIDEEINHMIKTMLKTTLDALAAIFPYLL